MSPLDLSFMFFIILMGYKILRDSIDFWNDIDQEAYIRMESRKLAEARANRAKAKPGNVTRTSRPQVRVPYRVCHVDSKESVIVPAPHVRERAGRQIERVA
ncbi:MAG: hypothetical protein K6F79_05300 [Saccharofermentans sp.]|nr:hypothetical protein [Saccharofermentans sp.]